MSGLVLGVESVPDGLASGLLAGVNPVAGLYAYLFGMVGGALFTGTTFMAIQATGAMSIIVADVDLAGRDDPARSLFTLTIVTGLVMIAAGLLRLGSFLRFVSNSVMTGFVSAVGINIVLGQLDNFTGYAADGGNRIARAFDLILHPGRIDPASITVGSVTVVGILWLRRTRLGPLGLVVAVVAGSVLAAILDAFDQGVATVGDVADVPRSLPTPTLPVFTEMPGFVVAAASLAFVGLVQGPGVSAGFPNVEERPADPSQDFVGQGAGNIAAGLFQGMPVGGSMSASSLVVSAGARSRCALLVAGAVMAIVILLFADAVQHVAMPALAGLLIVVGFGTIKPAKLVAVGRTGTVPLTVMTITLVLTMIIPLQFSVLVGVGISIILFVIGQSSRLVTRRIVLEDDGRAIEIDPPDELPPHDVVVIQPYGAIFFATAAVLRDQMPAVTDASRGSVVILRIRGASEAGATLLEMLRGYATDLRAVDSRFMIVTDNPRVLEQMEETGVADAIGRDYLYRGNDVLGETVRRAYDDATRWVEAHRPSSTALDPDPGPGPES
jgi:SulP family sulfate permease